MSNHRLPWWRQRTTQAVAACLTAALAGFLTAVATTGQAPATTTRTVIEAPKACVTALTEADQITDQAQDYLDEMIRLETVDGGLHDHRRGKGPHWDITHRHEAALTAATDRYAPARLSCLEARRG